MQSPEPELQFTIYQGLSICRADSRIEECSSNILEIKPTSKSSRARGES
ncbi:MAG: hypothetical protein ACTSUE_12295 [Promethearchaeota archaeon]